MMGYSVGEMPAVSPETRLVVLFDCSASNALELQTQNSCATDETLGRTSCDAVDDFSSGYYCVDQVFSLGSYFRCM